MRVRAAGSRTSEKAPRAAVGVLLSVVDCALSPFVQLFATGSQAVAHTLVKHLVRLLAAPSSLMMSLNYHTRTSGY
jgi:hypothetical protein